ncbi:hypothetical protein ACTWJ8_31875 [Streptomyces sp. SDT5-1]
MIVHDLGTLSTTLIGRAVLTVGATAGATAGTATALLVALAAAIHRKASR